jgi:hypothetical protein
MFLAIWSIASISIDEQGDDDGKSTVAECFQASRFGKIGFFVLRYLNLTFSGCRIRGLKN